MTNRISNEKAAAFVTLKLKSCGLEEIFLSADRDQVLDKDDELYALEACYQILDAIATINQPTMRD
jgi:hypothetical protein